MPALAWSREAWPLGQAPVGRQPAQGRCGRALEKHEEAQSVREPLSRLGPVSGKKYGKRKRQAFLTNSEKQEVWPGGSLLYFGLEPRPHRSSGTVDGSAHTARQASSCHIPTADFLREEDSSVSRYSFLENHVHVYQGRLFSDPFPGSRSLPSTFPGTVLGTVLETPSRSFLVLELWALTEGFLAALSGFSRERLGSVGWAAKAHWLRAALLCGGLPAGFDMGCRSPALLCFWRQHLGDLQGHGDSIKTL